LPARSIRRNPRHGISWVSAVGRLGAIAGPTLGGLLIILRLPLQQNFMIFPFQG